jgi:hypothetical protein
MKPTCYANTTELSSSVKLNTYKYNFINICGLPSDFGRYSPSLRDKVGEPFGVHHTFKIKIIL